MDITSPINLWKDYDVSALPLNVSELSPKTENDITVKELYFDGYTTVDGRTRTFLKILVNNESKGVILYLSDHIGVNESLVKSFYDLGYTVAILDYMGRSDELARYTMYPNSLSECNKRGISEFEISETGQLPHWYIWTCIARRSVKLLSEYYPDKKLFALGVGLGGSTVFKLATFDDGLCGCATLLNILPKVNGSGNTLINYHASLDNIAYAPITKIDMFMAVSSNDTDGSLDSMSELAENTQSLKTFRIVERSFADGIVSVYGDLDKFFTSRCNSQDLPRPHISASNSEGNLYFNIDIPDIINVPDEMLPQLNLYVSFCIEEAPFRNWMNIQTISLGKDKYMAHINVCQANKPINAFATLNYPSGVRQSSTLLSVIPKTLGIQSKQGVNHRKIYDGSMGTDGWTSRFGGKITLVNGPYEIEGVTSNDNSLITFKPGDPLFKVTADTLLQIMVCGKPQNLSVTVRDRDNFYNCTVEIKNSDDWHKFSLSHMNFKGTSGTLPDWSQILMLEFSSDYDFTVGSVLWV